MDLINRQDAIDAIVNKVSHIGLHNNSEVARYGATFRQHEIIDIIKSLPSEERKKGQWYLEHHVWFCDQCGKNPTKGMGYVQGTDELFDFCPNCGTEMQNAKQELVKDSDGLVKDLVKPMSSEEAVDLLDNLLGMTEDSQGNDYDKALHMGIDAIKRSQWIPCSERLPEDKFKVYLVTVNCWDGKKLIENRVFYGNEYYWESEGIVAWMPLPDPWKGAKDG